MRAASVSGMVALPPIRIGPPFRRIHSICIFNHCGVAMLAVFTPVDHALRKSEPTDLSSLPDNAVWIDMVKPSPGEDKAVEKLAGVEIPTREDMQEIEISS